MKSSIKTRVYQQGFTLIEALLTLFILSIGLLGVAGMQLEGMRSGDLAMQQTSAVIKAQDLIERARAVNRDTVNLYLGVFASASANDHGCNTSGVICDAIMMAEHDVFVWDASVRSLLPGVTAATMTSPANNTIRVAINWVDRGQPYNYSVTSLIHFDRNIPAP